MSHKSIRLLLEKTIDKIGDDIQYSYGPETDFNQAAKKGSTLVNTSPLVSVPSYRVNNVSNYMNEWRVEMAFWRPDNSQALEYAKILDDLDILVDTFINQLNFFIQDSDQFILQGLNKQPFIKAGADILTGWVLTFQILANDDTDYCVDC